MRRGEPISMRLNTFDILYVVVSGAAGLWQSWCFNRSGHWAFLVLMSVPFAVISFARQILVSQHESPPWRMLLTLWICMPLALVFGALVILGETEALGAITHTRINLPYYTFRLLLGEAAASLIWSFALVMSCRGSFRLSRARVLFTTATIYVAVLAAHAVSIVVKNGYHEDIYFTSESLLVTVLSALMIIAYTRNANPQTSQVEVSGL